MPLLQSRDCAGAELGPHRQTFDRRGETRGERRRLAVLKRRNAPVDQVRAADAITRRVFDKAAQGRKYVREHTARCHHLQEFIFTSELRPGASPFRNFSSEVFVGLGKFQCPLRDTPIELLGRGPAGRAVPVLPAAAIDAWFAATVRSSLSVCSGKSTRCAPVTMMPSLPSKPSGNSCDRKVFLSNSATHDRRPRLGVVSEPAPQIRADLLSGGIANRAPRTISIRAAPTSSFSRT